MIGIDWTTGLAASEGIENFRPCESKPATETPVPVNSRSRT